MDNKVTVAAECNAKFAMAVMLRAAELVGAAREFPKETRDMPPTQRSLRVLLKTAAVFELLDRLDLSQNELARRCGISRGYMSQLMRGERSPSPRLRRRMQEVLGVDDFHRLFIIVPAGDDGDGGGEGAAVP